MFSPPSSLFYVYVHMIWDYRSVSRSRVRTLLRGVPARGGRRRLRAVVSTVGLRRSAGWAFPFTSLRAICILSVPRLACLPLMYDVLLDHVVSAWCNNIILGNVCLGTIYVLVVHVLYLVVENPAATDCFGREQVVRYALPSPKLVQKFWLRDGTAYWALQLGIRAGPTVETFTGRSRV